MPTHRECANFSNGFCKLYGVSVDPNGPACPNFTPKTAVAAQAAPATAPLGAPSAVTAPIPPAVVGLGGMGLRRRRRRRNRARRGRSFPFW